MYTGPSLFKWAKYTHAGILMWSRPFGVTDGRMRLVVCEAMEGSGVRIVPLSYYLTRYKGVVEWYPIRQEFLHQDERTSSWPVVTQLKDLDVKAGLKVLDRYWTGEDNYGWAQIACHYSKVAHHVLKYFIDPSPNNVYSLAKLLNILKM